MARELTGRDLEILAKLVPECGATICGGSGHAFQSILPPVSNHYAESAEDFERRLEALDGADLQWLVDRILDGSESLGCVQEEDMEAFVRQVKKVLSDATGEAVLAYYLASGTFEP
ncbi:MAG: hypothetical protein AB7S61_01160 [Methanoregulaceae archaeon]